MQVPQEAANSNHPSDIQVKTIFSLMCCLESVMTQARKSKQTLRLKRV